MTSYFTPPQTPPPPPEFFHCPPYIHNSSGCAVCRHPPPAPPPQPSSRRRRPLNPLARLFAPSYRLLMAIYLNSRPTAANTYYGTLPPYFAIDNSAYRYNYSPPAYDIVPPPYYPSQQVVDLPEAIPPPGTYQPIATEPLYQHYPYRANHIGRNNRPAGHHRQQPEFHSKPFYPSHKRKASRFHNPRFPFGKRPMYAHPPNTKYSISGCRSPTNDQLDIERVKAWNEGVLKAKDGEENVLEGNVKARDRIKGEYEVEKMSENENLDRVVPRRRIVSAPAMIQPGLSKRMKVRR
nr:uncharacterized protein CI109_006113 [Kwoniella shandongensis]KAA5525540.1 hypothetical protein CI109_006113 [Kwoniella shandongensis]